MTLLCLDLSTSCTGVAIFEVTDEDPKLIKFDKLKSSTAGTARMGKLEKTLFKMKRLVRELTELVNEVKPDIILIEEIAGSKSRLTQKTLDGFHWLLYDALGPDWLRWVVLYDVTGSAGWRTHLGLKLDDADKEANKEAKKLNKSLPGSQKIPVIGPKHLSCRYANRVYGLSLDVDEDPTDGDVADAVSMGDAWIRYRHNSKGETLV